MYRSTLPYSPRLRFVVEPDGTQGAAPGDGEKKPAEGESAKDEQLGEKGLKALQAERDARAKAEADLAALRKQVEDASKTAEQKAADDLRAAQQAAADNAAKALRYEVAAEKGIPLNLAARLVGSTREDLVRDADDLKGTLAAVKSGTPKPDPSAGGGGGSDKGASVSAGRDLYAERHKKHTS